jgi:hypothetical protein
MLNSNRSKYLNFSIANDIDKLQIHFTISNMSQKIFIALFCTRDDNDE